MLECGGEEMSIEKEAEPKDGKVIILTGDQVRQLETFALALDSMASAINTMVIGIREITGESIIKP